jgi:hypothetical protein
MNTNQHETIDTKKDAAYQRYLAGFNPDDQEKREAALKEITDLHGQKVALMIRELRS